MSHGRDAFYRGADIRGPSRTSHGISDRGCYTGSSPEYAHHQRYQRPDYQSSRPKPFDRSASMRGTAWDYQGRHVADQMGAISDHQQKQSSRYGRRASTSGYRPTPARAPRSDRDPMSMMECDMYLELRPLSGSRPTPPKATIQFNRRASTSGYRYQSEDASPFVIERPPLTMQYSYSDPSIDSIVPDLMETPQPFDMQQIIPYKAADMRRFNRRASASGTCNATWESDQSRQYNPPAAHEQPRVLAMHSQEETRPYRRRASIQVSELSMSEDFPELNDPSNTKRDCTSAFGLRASASLSSVPSIISSDASSIDIDMEEDRWGNSMLTSFVHPPHSVGPESDDDATAYGDKKPAAASRALPYEPRKVAVQRQTSSSPNVIEIAPGQFMELRGTDETLKAIETGFYVPCACLCCDLSFFCIQDASLVLCPACRVVNPLDGSPGTSGGVGLGFTIEELQRWQKRNQTRAAARARVERGAF